MQTYQSSTDEVRSAMLMDCDIMRSWLENVKDVRKERELKDANCNINMEEETDLQTPGSNALSRSAENRELPREPSYRTRKF